VATLNPGEALAAVRSFPRRLRELFEPQPDDTASVDDLATTGNPSALIQAGAMALELDAIATSLERIRLESLPALPRWTSGTGAVTARAAVRAVEDASGRAAHVIERYEDAEWLRGATVEGAPVTAIELLRERVDGSATALRGAERAMEAARAS
jgi:hypothetical protein